ncbi:hypothetical protein ACO0LD_05275 [Undibacterium sp. Ji83W]|uniref:hypothetical protein n=1 Tax=Undibacterium sp. Ji83W TaxID=3413043 RepID=UPI003BF0BF07
MKKLFISFFCAWFLALNCQCAYATTVPVNNFANAMTGSLTGNMLGRGFAATDPRVYATVRAVSLTLARWGLQGAYVGFVSAAFVLGVGAAIGAGIGVVHLGKNAGEAAATWLWNYNNPKMVTVSTPASVVDTPPMVQGGGQYTASANGKVLVASTDPQATAQQFVSLMGPGYRMREPCSGGPTTYQCTGYQWDSVNNRWGTQSSFSVNGAVTGAPTSCGAQRYVDKDGKCVALTPVQTGSNGLPITVADAVTGIPGLDMTQPLNPAITAGLANKAWIDAASRPGYDGIPYDYTRPITVTDVNKWTDENTNFAPTIDSFTRTLTGTNPFELPLTTTAVGTVDNTQVNTGTNSAASQAQINLGADPGIGTPNLEDTPTAEMILRPILNLMPDLKNYTAPAISGECPKPQFQLFENTYTIDKQCDILEQNKGVIRISMLLAFTLASLFIVLRA